MSVKLSCGDKAPDFSLLSASQRSTSLKTFANQPLIIIFTRYVGCPICQLDTVQYAKDYSLVRNAGMELLVVFQSEASILSKYKEQEFLPYIALSDVARASYDAYGVESGFAGFLSAKNLSPLVGAIKAGKKHGKFEGNEFQYPAVFVLDEDHRISFAHYGEYIADSLKIPDILKQISLETV